jgi:hypothetical protein
MLGDLEHFVGKHDLRNVRKILSLVSDFVRVTQRECQKTFAHRLDNDWALSIGENHRTHADQTFFRHGIPYDREGFLSNLIAQGNVIGSVVIARIDLLPRQRSGLTRSSCCSLSVRAGVREVAQWVGRPDAF